MIMMVESHFVGPRDERPTDPCLSPLQCRTVSMKPMQLIVLSNSKCKSLHDQRKKPAKLMWTQVRASYLFMPPSRQGQARGKGQPGKGGGESPLSLSIWGAWLIPERTIVGEGIALYLFFSFFFLRAGMEAPEQEDAGHGRYQEALAQDHEDAACDCWCFS